jgi:hypothetical protein
MNDDGLPIVLLFIVGFLLGALVAGTSCYNSGQDLYRSRACVAELALAKTGVDTLAVVQADSTCLRFTRGVK